MASQNHKTGMTDQHGAPPVSGAFEGVMVAILVTAAGIGVAYALELTRPVRIGVMVVAMAAGAGLGGLLTRSKRIRAAEKRATEETERRQLAEREYQRKLTEAKDRGEI